MSGPAIFINYRRADAAGDAGRLYDELRRRLPPARLFMDVDNLGAGEDFVEALDRALSVSDIMLVIIGRSWVSVADRDGHRRLDDPDDYVCREIRTALERHIRVIPILVQDAPLPTAGDLPAALIPVIRRQAVQIRHARYDDDVSNLVRELKQAIPGLNDRSQLDHFPPRVSWRRVLVTGAITFVLAASLGLVYSSYHPRPRGETSSRAGHSFVPVDISDYGDESLDWLSPAPVGDMTFGRIPFTLLSGDRAVALTRTTGRPTLPREISIPIAQGAGVKRVHVLVNASYSEKATTETIGHFAIFYADTAAVTTIDLINGVTIQEGWKKESDLFVDQSHVRSLPGVEWRTVFQQQQQRGPDKAFAFLDALSVTTNSDLSINRLLFEPASENTGICVAALTLER